MKSSLAFCLAVLAITVTSQIGALPTRKIQSGEEFMVDNGGIEQTNGSVVNITAAGLMNIGLEGNGFGFEFCTMKCNADVLVCYDGDTPSQNTSDLCDSQCGFFVTGQDNKTTVSSSSASRYNGKDKQDNCDIITTVNGEMRFRNNIVTRCVPKIVNGMVKINVSIASSDCPLLIRDAFLMPETTSSPPTTATMSTTPGHNFSTTTKGGVSGAGNGTTIDEPSFMESYWWIILIIVIVLIIAGIGVGVTIYCLKCKKGKKEQDGYPAAPLELPGPKTTIVEQNAPAPKGKRPPLPPSVMNPPSILSQKSLQYINRESN